MVTVPVVRPLETINFADFVRPGDHVVWTQGTGEPRTLTEALVEQRSSLGGIHAFIGISFGDTLWPGGVDGVELTSICGIGKNADLVSAGALDVIPCHVTDIPTLIESGTIGVDVALVQVSPPGHDRRYCLGTVADYVRLAVERARVVVAEINDQVPRTPGEALTAEEIDIAISTSRPLVEIPARGRGKAERIIGERVAELVPDGSIIQLGIGAVPDAITAALAGKRDLGFHSGMMGDGIVDLMEAGVITNERKTVDKGVSIAGGLIGTRRLYDFAHENESVRLEPLTYTHAVDVISRHTGFVAINSAIEVDLTGQVNAEVVGGRYVGAVGGQVDFVRGAAASPGGRSIIALPSSVRDGTMSRIVAGLDGPVTTARSDVDLVVTEFGVAALRGMPVRERVRRMLSIAHPAVRAQLRKEAGL